MKVIRDFPIGITVNDPIKVAEDKMAFVTEYITSMYEKKCFNGYLIDKIIDIISCSDMSLLVNNLQGYCNINAIFRAECTAFIPNEPIAKCKIININEQSTINCSDEKTAVVIIRWEKFLEFLRIDQYVPIHIVRVLYTPGNQRAGVYGKLYIPPIENEYYRIIDTGLPEKAKEKRLDNILTLNDLIQQIDDLLKHFDEVQKDKATAKIYDKFVEVISQKAGLPTTPAGYKNVINVLDVAKKRNLASLKTDKLLVYSNNINHILPLVDIIKADSKVTAIEVDSSTFLFNILSKYLVHLLTLKMFMDTYNTPELISSHENLWKFYTFIKKKYATA